MFAEFLYILVMLETNRINNKRFFEDFRHFLQSESRTNAYYFIILIFMLIYKIQFPAKR